VVAAGNANTDASNTAPANCTGVIAVAAINRSGGKASYSNYGAVVDVAAPGGDSGAGILSTLNAGTTTPGADSYAAYMGTSMATPHVAGVAALMFARNPALTPDQLETRLKASVRAFPVACSQCGTGILDANAAVDAAASTATVTTTTVAETESNDTLATAQALSTLPVQVNGTIASPSDVDHYRLQVAAGQRVTAKLTPNSSANYDLYAYTASGALVGASTLGTGQTDQMTVSNIGTTAATLVLQVRRVSGASGSTGTYGLSVAAN
jgi:serine protease